MRTKQISWKGLVGLFAIASLASAAMIASLAGMSSSQAVADSSASLSGEDASFIEQAARGGIAEVQEAQLAQKQGSNHVKDAAKQLEQDHTAANEKLKQIAKAEGAMLPSEPAEERKGLYHKLKASKGAEFDRQYLDAGVAAHQKTIALFEKTQASTKNASIKWFTTETLPTPRKHLAMMQGMQTGHSAGM